jgi:hypothetical protein
MFKGMTDKAKSLTDGMNITQKLAAAKNLAVENMTSGKSKAIELFEQHRPEIENILVNGLLSVAEEKLQDNETLQRVFEKGYEALPMPVRLLLPRTTFVEFSMKEKEPLLLKLRDYKQKRTATNSDSNE